MANQLLAEIYDTEQRRLDNYVGAAICNSRRFFTLLQKHAKKERSALFTTLNSLMLKGKEEGMIAYVCRSTLRDYQQALATELI